jgi:MFS family permease
VSNHPFVPLRHRAVRLLWGAAVVSDIGTWVQLIVVGSLVASGTGSAVQTGLVALATFMPQGIASPVGGLLADRFDRRRVFASALIGQATITSILAIVLGTGVRTPWVLTLLILMGSAAGATGAPSYAAMQPDLVPPHELMQMVSLGVYSWNSGRVVGPLLGSLLVLAVGPAWTIGFNALSFVVMAGAVVAVRRPFRRTATAAAHPGRSPTGGRHSRHARVLARCRDPRLQRHGRAVHGPHPDLRASRVRRGTGPPACQLGAGIGATCGGIGPRCSPRFRRSLRAAGARRTPSSRRRPQRPGRHHRRGDRQWLGDVHRGSAIIQCDAPPARRTWMSLMRLHGCELGIGLMFIGSIGDLVNLRGLRRRCRAPPIGSVITRRPCRWRVAIDGSDLLPVSAHPALAA